MVIRSTDLSLRLYNRFTTEHQSLLANTITRLTTLYSRKSNSLMQYALAAWKTTTLKLSFAKEKQKLSSYIESLTEENEKLYKEHKGKTSTSFINDKNSISPITKGTVFEKLHHEASNKKEANQKFEEIKEINELENCTFQPLISKYSHNMPANGNVHDRLYKEQKQTYEQYKLEREAYEMQQCTFHPNASHISETHHERHESSKVFERLHNEAESKQKFKKERSAILSKIETDEVKQCSFKPQINSASRKSGRLSEGSKDAFDKLYKDKEDIKRRQMLREANAESERIKNCPFNPSILRNRSISAKGGKVNPERLYVESKTRMEEKKREMQEQELKMSNATKKLAQYDPQVYERMYKMKEKYDHKKKELEKKVLKVMQ